MLLVDPLPYEPIFSPFARSIARFDAPNVFFLDHFDLSSITSLYAAFPAGISRVAQKVQPSHRWHDPLVMLREHTAFRYYTRFYAADRVRELEERILANEDVEWIAQSLGLAHYRRQSGFGRAYFCIECVRSEKQEHGFANYHCEHHLPAVVVCWLHNEPLSTGCAKCGRLLLPNASLIMPGECSCDSMTPTRISDSLPGRYDVLCWIARESAGMLHGPAAPLRRNILWERINAVGFKSDRYVNWDLVVKALEARYGSETLDWLGYPIITNGRPSSWWSTFLYDSEAACRSTSIAALLFVGLFFDTLQIYQSAPELSVETRLDNRVASGTEAASAWQGELAKRLKVSTPLAIAKDLGIRDEKVYREAVRQKLVIPLSTSTVSRLGRHKIEEIRQSIRTGMPHPNILAHFHIGWPYLLQIVVSDSAFIELWHATRIKRKPASWRDRLSTLLEGSTLSAVCKSVGEEQRTVLREALRQKLTVALPNELVARIGIEAVEEIKDLRLQGATRESLMAQFDVSLPDLMQIELSDSRMFEATEAKIAQKKKELQTLHRERLLKFKATRSTVYRGTLIKELNGSYSYSIKNDRAWFEAEFPDKAPVARRLVTRIDWPERDEQCVREVDAAYGRLRKQGSLPLQLSRLRILQEAGWYSVFRHSESLLPKTANLLKKLAESKPSFYERRIRWALEKIVESGEALTIKRLGEVTELSTKTLRHHKSRILLIARSLGLGT